MSSLFARAAQLSQSHDPVAQSRAAGFALVPVLPAPDRFPVLETEPANAIETVSPAAEFVFGTPFDPRCVAATRAGAVRFTDKTVRLIRNARVIGYRSALTADDALFLGVPLQTATIPSDGTSAGREGFLYLPEQNGTPMLAFYQPVAREPFAGRALFVGGLEHSNYGSFLFRLLPKILLARDLRLRPDIIVVPERMPWTIQGLALAGFEVPVMSAAEAAAFVFDELILIDEFNRGDPYLDPQTFARIEGLAAQARRLRPQAQRQRIYVSRRVPTMLQPHYRPLTNEAEIEHLVADRGFRVVRPEMHSLASQIAIFAHAQHIVGPSGSGMLNAMFAPPGASVIDMESYTVVVRQHARIYGSSGKRYGFVFGPIDQPGKDRPQYRPWSVDPADVRRGVDHFVENI